MKRAILNLSTLAALFLLIGCASYYPQVVDIPLIQGKGDTRFNVGCFAAPELNGKGDITPDEGYFKASLRHNVNFGFHGTLSVGVSDILAVQAYTSFDALLRCHLQGALGLYKGFENNTVIEMYGGGGFGTAGFWNLETDFYSLCFTQFNIGKTSVGNGNLDYGFGLKGGYVFNDYEEYNIHYSDKANKKNSWIIEPSAFIRFGGKKAKMNIMVNYMWADNIPKPYYFPLSIGMGLNYKFGKYK